MATAGGVIKQGANGPTPGRVIYLASVCKTGTFNCLRTNQQGAFLIPQQYVPGETLTAGAGNFDAKNFVPQWNEAHGLYWAVVELNYNPPPPRPSSCFTGETKVLMANGDSKRIDEVLIGDVVIGQYGKANKVVEIEKPLLGDRLLYSLNGSAPFITSEHPLMTEGGWKSIQPEATARENPNLKVKALGLGDQVVKLAKVVQPAMAGSEQLLATVEPILETAPLLRQDAIRAGADTPLYNLLLDGDHTYFANDFLVHNKGGH